MLYSQHLFFLLSYFTDCPAEVYIEVQGCGEVFIPQSPNLLTSGLLVVDIYLARGLAAKVISASFSSIFCLANRNSIFVLSHSEYQAVAVI